MNQLKKFSLPFIAMIVLLCSCEKEGLLQYSANDAVNFVTKSVTYSFLTNPGDEYIQEMEVAIIGDTVSYDRYFNAVAVKDASTTAPDNLYEILGGVIKAGEFKGKLSVKLKKSPELANSTVNLKIRLVDSDDFKAGNVEAREAVISWTDQVVVPSWTYYRIFFTAQASPAAYRAIVVSTGLTVFAAADYSRLGTAGATALGTKFGDYVKQWNKDNPNNHLKHDAGALIGQDIVPVYYTKSKYD
jgi:hypothetical protein